MTPTVLIPLPLRDFDPSEVAIPWKLLKEAGVSVRFATPTGASAAADPMMLSGEGLDLWGWIPGLRKLKLLGLMLRANRDARSAYRELQADSNFATPLAYPAIKLADFDGLLLPGGHWARGMREYLESPVLQGLVAEFFESGKPVAAICHGTVLAARSTSKRTGKSILFGRKTTGLTWQLERAAWTTMKYAGRFWDPGYYRTYLEQPGEDAGYRSVQAEVSRALAQPADFLDVDRTDRHFRMKTDGLHRDSANDERAAFVVQDGNYLSARWPGDVHTLGRRFCALLLKRSKEPVGGG